MNLTMIIAIIGCVTGVTSLLIEAAGFFSERSRVKLGTFDELNNFIYLNGDVINCFLNLRVMNTGGKYIIVQDVYMRRPGYDKKTASGIRPPYGVFSATPWKYCNGDPVETPPKVHLPSSIPAGGVFEAVFAFTDVYDDCYKTDENFIYPSLCVVMADGTVKEISLQTILAKNDSFTFVDSAEDKEYSMILDLEDDLENDFEEDREEEI